MKIKLKNVLPLISFLGAEIFSLGSLRFVHASFFMRTVLFRLYVRV